MQERIAAIIKEYDAQGDHRTGTDVDHTSADWLVDRIASLGTTPQLDSFTFQRVQVKTAKFFLEGAPIEGVPLFDCGFSGAGGIEGSIGVLGGDAEIGVAMSWPIVVGQADEAKRQAAATQLEAARKNGRHQAIVLVTEESMPPDGVATINAPSFLKPYGPPVLQVPNRRWRDIQTALKTRTRARVVVDCEYVKATSSNVQATITGTDASLSPLLVMTPRSGWWSCASERGGGIAAFLEIIRAVGQLKAPRTVIFTANAGHELGHTGLDQYLHAQPDLVKRAHAWIHLGANFAASQGGGIRMQYSNDTLRSLVLSHCRQQGVAPASEALGGTRPAGEARNIFDGGGQYISIVGSNNRFHHPSDRFPDAVDLALTTKWVAVLVGSACELAMRPA